MGASLAKTRAGNVRGCAGLEVESEGEGLIAIVECFGSVIGRNDYQSFTGCTSCWIVLSIRGH